MMRLDRYSPNSAVVFTLFLVLLVTSCGEGGAPNRKEPLFSSMNDRYGLSVEFFGEWAGPDGDPKSQYVIDRILLREAASGESIEYQPDDTAGLRTSLGFFRDVWSPDGQYLVLPRGRFEGFVIFASSRLFETLRKKQFTDSIVIRYRGQSDSAWHGFAGWAGDHVLLFDAGVESSRFRFSYDLNLKQLNASSPPVPLLGALNSMGAVMITWIP